MSNFSFTANTNYFAIKFDRLRLVKLWLYIINNKIIPFKTCARYIKISAVGVPPSFKLQLPLILAKLFYHTIAIHIRQSYRIFKRRRADKSRPAQKRIEHLYFWRFARAFPSSPHWQKKNQCDRRHNICKRFYTSSRGADRQRDFGRKKQ